MHALPALLFFKKGEEDPIIFAGDLKRSNKILDWLSSQKDPDIDRIEEVEASTLKKLIENEKYIVVVFYDDDCDDCAQILETLETIGKFLISFLKLYFILIDLLFSVNRFRNR